MTQTHWFSISSGRIEIEMTMEDARSASHPGQCDDDVRAVSEQPYIAAQLAKIKPEVLRRELEEYGAWDDEELADHDQNIQRIVWLAAGDIRDNCG